MAGCGHTAEEHQAEIRALLHKNQPEFAAWLESGQAERVAIAAMPSEPLFPPKPRLVVDPGLTHSGFAYVDEDWYEQDEQDWMNEIRSSRKL